MRHVHRVATALLLAFALLFAQQAALLHALAHATDLTAPQKQLPPAHQCGECVAGADLSGGLVPASPSVVVDAVRVFEAAPRAYSARIETRVPFRSRAPPALS
jgi:hypothetical protein